MNLFIAVVLNNLESVKHEQQVVSDRASTHHGVLEAIEALHERLAELEEHLRAMPPPGAGDLAGPPRATRE